MLRLICTYSLLFFAGTVHAADIEGIVIDMAGKNVMGNVYVENIYTHANTSSDKDGKFTIGAAKGELLEFKKLGYKTVRLRIPGGNIPSYFKVIMQEGSVELPAYELKNHLTDYQKDSVKFYTLYKNALEFPQLTALGMIQHPFSALSKTNRQKWAFQKEYGYFQEQKFIDYAFNERLITNLTGLKGDSLNAYMRKNRPGYEQLRSMNEYSFYFYIKQTVEQFRTGRRLRPGGSRSSN